MTIELLYNAYSHLYAASFWLFLLFLVYFLFTVYRLVQLHRRVLYLESILRERYGIESRIFYWQSKIDN